MLQASCIYGKASVSENPKDLNMEWIPLRQRRGETGLLSYFYKFFEMIIFAHKKGSDTSITYQ
jgi:hypothetical protein